MSLGFPRVLFVSGLHGGRQTRTAVADAPLTGFAGRVQYPLETPSRLGPHSKLYRLKGMYSVPLVTLFLVHFKLRSSAKMEDPTIG